LGTLLELGALIESVSAIGRLSREGDLWSGRAGVRSRDESGRNKIAKRFEETNKVKWRIYFVK
jgi:hypothetical protein